MQRQLLTHGRGLDFMYLERIDKPKRCGVGREFEWPFNEAIKYQEGKNRKKLKGNI
jgi:hypothetical protein